MQLICPYEIISRKTSIQVRLVLEHQEESAAVSAAALTESMQDSRHYNSENSNHQGFARIGSLTPSCIPL